MSSAAPALRAQVDAQLARQRYAATLPQRARAVLAALFSFETLLILFVFSGMYKSDPRLAAIPGDLTAILFGLSVLAGIALMLRGGLKLRPRALNLLWLFLALVVWLYVSMLWSPSIAYAQRKAMFFPVLTGWTIFASAFIIAPDERRVRRFFAMLLAFAMFVTWESFYALRSNFISGNFRVLIRALGSHYGTLGVVIGNGLLLLLLYMLYYRRRAWERVALGGLIAGIVGLLLLMGSRTSLSFPIIASVIPLSLNVRWPRSAAGLLRIVFVAAVGLVLVVVMWNRLVDMVPGGPATIRRFATLGRRGIESEGRFRNMFHGVRIINEASVPQLVFGHGAGSWPILLGEPDAQLYPHNIVIEVLVELGLVGLALLMLLIWYAVHTLGPKHVIRRDPLRVFLLTMGFSFFIVASVSGDIHENRGLFMFLGLMMYGVGRTYRDSIRP